MTINTFVWIWDGIIFMTLVILFYINFIKKKDNIGILIKTPITKAPNLKNEKSN